MGFETDFFSPTKSRDLDPPVDLGTLQILSPWLFLGDGSAGKGG